MPLDLTPVRTTIAGIVDTIPELTRVLDHEERAYALSDLPVAMVWRDETTLLQLGDPEGPFGQLTRVFTWKIRCWLRLDNDAAAQAQIDVITIRLIEAFALSANIAALQAVGVDWPNLTLQTADAVTDLAQPVVLVEATLETPISWTP